MGAMGSRTIGSNICRAEAGFSLLEVINSTAILVAGAGGLAQLFVMSMQSNRRAQETTFAALLAKQKMEDLLARGASLEPSPAGALERNTPGYCEFLGPDGRPLASDAFCGEGSSVAPGTAFIRRWAVVPRSASPTDATVLQVLVAGKPERETTSADAGGRPAPGSVHLTAALARKAN
jgi:type II secretory pathway pseudopilin PulG